MNNQPHSPNNSLKPIEGQPYIFYGSKYTFHQLIIDRLRTIEFCSYDLVYIALMKNII
jgi:hypothetical protein